MRKIISVIGESDASPENYSLAYEVGKRLARAGVVVACGGLSGVMEAVAKGAREAGGAYNRHTPRHGPLLRQRIY